MDVALDREVLLARREVLPEGDDVDAEPGELAQHLLDLVAGLAEAEHQAGLGDRAALPRVLEDLVAARVAGLDADLARQPRHGLEVVREHVGIGVEHDVDVLGPALEVAGEDLERHPRARGLHAPDRLGPVRGAEVRQVVAIDAGDHGVLEVEARRASRRPGAARPGSGGSGRPVVTSQNRHERVQMSPRIMIVSARRVQHSPMFGQLALSHTVWSCELLDHRAQLEVRGLGRQRRADPLRVTPARPGRSAGGGRGPRGFRTRGIGPLLTDDRQVHARIGHLGRDTPPGGRTRGC